MHRQRDVQGVQHLRAVGTRRGAGHRQREATLARDLAEQVEVLAVGEVAVERPEDVALTLLARTLDEQQSLDHVAHVDVAEAAIRDEAQRAAQVLLGHEGRDAIDVAGADHERRTGHDDVLARRRRRERDLLAGSLRRDVGILARRARETASFRRAARPAHPPCRPTPRSRRGRRGPLRRSAAAASTFATPLDVDRLHVGALGLEVRDDPGEVVDRRHALERPDEALAIGHVALRQLPTAGVSGIGAGARAPVGPRRAGG